MSKCCAYPDWEICQDGKYHNDRAEEFLVKEGSKAELAEEAKDYAWVNSTHAPSPPAYRIETWNKPLPGMKDNSISFEVTHINNPEATRLFAGMDQGEYDDFINLKGRYAVQETFTDGDGNTIPVSAFVTKDSGNHLDISGGGRRDSAAGKPRFDLLFPLNVPYVEQMLTRFAALMARGAEKYAGRNWEQFCSQEALEHAQGSLGRHYAQYQSGDTSEDHAAAIMANVMFIEYIKGVLAGKWLPLKEGE